jgi:hypothetical protein
MTLQIHWLNRTRNDGATAVYKSAYGLIAHIANTRFSNLLFLSIFCVIDAFVGRQSISADDCSNRKHARTTLEIKSPQLLLLLLQQHDDDEDCCLNCRPLPFSSRVAITFGVNII